MIQWQDKMSLWTANLSGFEVIVVTYMRPSFAFFGLLLCLIATRADEQGVIKDSEAVRYVGRYVEVRGLVASSRPAHLGLHLSVSDENTPTSAVGKNFT